jgi:N-acetylmuramic acid 6-phosphate etherase
MLAANDKLRDRQLRVLAAATGAATEDCRRAVRESGGDAKVAVVMLIAHAGAEPARQALVAAHGHVHVAPGLLDRPG